jgi:uncharacterized membrane protein
MMKASNAVKHLIPFGVIALALITIILVTQSLKEILLAILLLMGLTRGFWLLESIHDR